MSLAVVPLAARYRVTGVRSGTQMAHRLLEMGLLEGVEVEVIRRAPFGDPLHVRVGDYELSLRNSEAELVDVAKI